MGIFSTTQRSATDHPGMCSFSLRSHFHHSEVMHSAEDRPRERTPHMNDSWPPKRNNRELEQTGTTTATRGTRKQVPPYWTSLLLRLFLTWLKFHFCQSPIAFIVSNYRRANVVITQNIVLALSLTSHENPEIKSILHIHMLLLSSAISFIVSPALLSWSRVLVLKLPKAMFTLGDRALVPGQRHKMVLCSNTGHPRYKDPL